MIAATYFGLHRKEQYLDLMHELLAEIQERANNGKLDDDLFNCPQPHAIVNQKLTLFTQVPYGPSNPPPFNLYLTVKTID